MNTFTVLLIIYISINSFIVGFNYANDFLHRNDTRGKILSLTWILISLLFGTIIYGVLIIWAFISGLIKFLNEFFQIRFLFTFYFTKKWDSLEEDKVKEINNFANKKDKTKLRNRIYIYCVNLLNKRLEKNKLKKK